MKSIDFTDVSGCCINASDDNNKRVQLRLHQHEMKNIFNEGKNIFSFMMRDENNVINFIIAKMIEGINYAKQKKITSRK